jgi:malonyl-CoA O-methyltransferase
MSKVENAWFALDRMLLRFAFERAAYCYDQAKLAIIHLEIGNRLIERLELIKIQPELVLDFGCATGAVTAMVLQKYSLAQVVGLEIASSMVDRARKRVSSLYNFHGVVGNPEELPLASCSCDLIFSNLSLHWFQDLEQVFTEFRRVLKPGGVLLFSTLGPDTLIELRSSWQSIDKYNHVNFFIDMYDIGDALVRARLAGSVIDVEKLTLTYPSVDRLTRDLKMLGATNVTAGRNRGLTGKGIWQEIRANYAQLQRADGLLPITCEVVYGHAWNPL